jgi:hypothetical protein
MKDESRESRLFEAEANAEGPPTPNPLPLEALENILISIHILISIQSVYDSYYTGASTDCRGQGQAGTSANTNQHQHTNTNTNTPANTNGPRNTDRQRALLAALHTSHDTRHTTLAPYTQVVFN